MTGRVGRAWEEHESCSHVLLFFLLAPVVLLIFCRLKQMFDFSGAGLCSVSLQYLVSEHGGGCPCAVLVHSPGEPSKRLSVHNQTHQLFPPVASMWPLAEPVPLKEAACLPSGHRVWVHLAHPPGTHLFSSVS